MRIINTNESNDQFTLHVNVVKVNNENDNHGQACITGNIRCLLIFMMNEMID